MLAENPAAGIRNPKPKRPEIMPFASWRELETIAEELGPRFGAIPHLRRRYGPAPGGMDRPRTPRRGS
jgi:hypothetical protein